MTYHQIRKCVEIFTACRNCPDSPISEAEITFVRALIKQMRRYIIKNEQDDLLTEIHARCWPAFYAEKGFVDVVEVDSR